MRRIPIFQRSISITIFVFLAMIIVIPLRAVLAGGVVGSGSPDSCTETALEAALAGGGPVTFDCGPGPYTILLTSQKSINEGTDIDGAGLITLSGGNSTRLFDVGAALTLRNITLTRGYFNGDGGAIRNNSNGTLILENTIIENSTATLSGGAIVSTGPLTITNSVLAANSASNGGALYLRFAGAQTTLEDSVLHGNQATYTDSVDGWGGGILMWDGAVVEIRGTDIISNTGRQGGGIYNYMSTITLTDVTFRQNSVGDRGGGLYNYSGTGYLTKVTFSGNQASVNGGGMRNFLESMTTLTNVTFSENSAGWKAGGMSNHGSTAILTYTTFKDNSADGYGGALLHQAVETGDRTLLRNSILVGSPDGNGCSVDSASVNDIESAGFNLYDDSSCEPYLTLVSDRQISDPLLGPLEDNGGFTLTHLPQPGSPALDGGQCLVEIPEDQRGVGRPQGAACDIGAVERREWEHFSYVPLIVH